MYKDYKYHLEKELRNWVKELKLNQVEVSIGDILSNLEDIFMTKLNEKEIIKNLKDLGCKIIKTKTVDGLRDVILVSAINYK